MLNAIWSICRNGIKFGSQETYVDCPSREKGQYLGDNTIITHAHAYLTGDLRLFRKSLHDFALLASRVCPGMMAVASGSYMQEIADFSFQWPLQLLQYYKLSGDLEFLEQMLPVAENMLHHFAQFRREDGLLACVSDKWNLVDWPETMRDGYEFDLKYPIGEGCHNVLNAFYYGAMNTVADIQEIVHGVKSDSLLTELANVKAAFIRVFYNKETGLFVDAEGSGHSSLHANALPLLFDLVPKDAVQTVVALMRAKRLSCGVYMAYFVLQALAVAGEYELVYELITSDDHHSWRTMVNEGATTCFEVWSKDLKANASLCHPWASAPIPVLIEHIIGIKPTAAGWKQVIFAPRLPESLREVKLTFRIPAGTIIFEYTNEQMKLTVPEGVSVVGKYVNGVQKKKVSINIAERTPSSNTEGAKGVVNWRHP
ncbi:alpha-L-rhamnosidase C-terminal domain-containing protein [Paenibacillus ginsengarvi]|uniref:alpha-L-rhamnosidase-related protein n=1 Tax=Paenibacillus ginsengarvi TaxID=400777 RepID=UPI001F015D7E|nr:alpha-L-rhamnosidase C-terminal domain-containing protein [Paenibacillus ginsengarvi]